jgi:hypothetical protein
MASMRRMGVGLVAAGYSLSFLVVCLGACLAQARGGGHGCCPESEGMRAPTADCCLVVPGVSQAPAPVIAAPPAVFASRAPIHLAPRLSAPGLLAAPTPSPPLVVVLRI